MNALEISSMDLFDLPSLPLRLADSFPEIRCIYFVLDAFGNAMYIGKAAINLNKRMKGHHKKKLFWSIPFVRVAYVEISASANIEKIERELIEAMKPSYNVNFNPSPKLPIVESMGHESIMKRCNVKPIDTWHITHEDLVKCLRFIDRSITDLEIQESLDGSHFDLWADCIARDPLFPYNFMFMKDHARQILDKREIPQY